MIPTVLRRAGTVVSCLTATVAGCGGERGAAEVAVGRSAPAYETKTLAGDMGSLAALRGKVVLLNVWATWCIPCRQEIPYLQQLHVTHGAQGLQVIGVSVDAPFAEAKIASFAKDIGMTYPTWLDPDQRVATVFFAYGVPASYLIDRHGVLRWRHVGVLRESNQEFNAVLQGALKEVAAPEGAPHPAADLR